MRRVSVKIPLNDWCCSTLTYDKETVGIESEAVCLVDGLTDDYEFWYGEHSEASRRDKSVTYVRNPRNFAQNSFMSYPESTKLKSLPPLGVVRQWY